MKIKKKDGTIEEYNEQKIINAVNKAAERAMIQLSEDDYQKICNGVWEEIVQLNLEECEIYQMHNIVETVLEELFPEVAKRYREYRNYKKDFIHMMDKVYKSSQSIRYIGDKSNANTDSSLVAFVVFVCSGNLSTNTVSDSAGLAVAFFCFILTVFF